MIGFPWPAGRYSPQHAFEPPRAHPHVKHRAERLHAIGNAAIPAIAYVAGERIASHIERDRS